MKNKDELKDISEIIEDLKEKDMPITNIKPENIVENIVNDTETSLNETVIDDEQTELVSKDLPTTNETKRNIGKLLAICQERALEIIDSTLEIIGKSETKALADLTLLVDTLKALSDIKLTHEWTTKLAKIIEKSPQHLPSNRVNPLLSKLRAHVLSARKLQASDNRTGVGKASSDMNDLPSDE